MALRAVVTGGGQGIGRAVVHRLIEVGWAVLAIDRLDRSTDFPPEAEYLRCDIRDIEESVEDLGAFCGPGLDALVNNAAVQPIGAAARMPVSEWERVFAVNTHAAAVMVGLCEEWLAARGGAVVNVASVHAIATSPGLGVYAASKAALVSLTRSLALELAAKGIRVNAVLPGAVDTEMLRAGLGRSDSPVGEAIEELARRTVMGRIASPREIAMCVEFLADQKRSSFVTGSSLVADGGALARLSTE